MGKLDWSKLLKSGQRIFIGSHAAVPTALINDLIENAKHLHDIEIVQLITLSDNKWALPEHQQLFKVNTFFISIQFFFLQQTPLLPKDRTRRF